MDNLLKEFLLKQADYMYNKFYFNFFFKKLAKYEKMYYYIYEAYNGTWFPPLTNYCYMSFFCVYLLTLIYIFSKNSGVFRYHKSIILFVRFVVLFVMFSVFCIKENQETINSNDAKNFNQKLYFPLK